MQTRASCASKSPGAQEAHVVGRDHRHAAARGQRHRGRHVALLAAATRRAAARGSSGRRTAPPGREQLLGLRLAAGDQRATDVAVGGAGQRDQAGGGSRVSQARSTSGCAALLALEPGARSRAA